MPTLLRFDPAKRVWKRGRQRTTFDPPTNGVADTNVPAPMRQREATLQTKVVLVPVLVLAGMKSIGMEANAPRGTPHPSAHSNVETGKGQEP